MKVGDLVYYRKLKGETGIGVICSFDKENDPVVLIHDEGCDYELNFYRSDVWLVGNE